MANSDWRMTSGLLLLDDSFSYERLTGAILCVRLLPPVAPCFEMSVNEPLLWGVGADFIDEY